MSHVSVLKRSLKSWSQMIVTHGQGPPPLVAVLGTATQTGETRAPGTATEAGGLPVITRQQ